MSVGKLKVDQIREIALNILVKIHRKKGYINIILNEILEEEKVAIRDAALINEITYGVVRNRKKIDWIISQFCKKDFDKTPVWIKNILRMGVYQLLFLERIPDYAVCNESVKLAKKYGNSRLANFVNGILRNINKNKDSIYWPDKDKEPSLYISTVYSHPCWIIERWLERFGFEDTIKICEANNKIPPLVIRTNTLKISRSDLKKALKDKNISVTEGIFAPEALYIKGLPNITKFPAYQEGLFQIQDEASMLVSHLVDPLAEELVIDVCSAPGGKTTHLAQLMNNQGTVLAFDVNQARLSIVEENCQRLGINIVKTLQNDATKLNLDFLGKADKVLADVPCSGLGVLRRKPDLKWQPFNTDRFQKLSRLQLQILSAASKYVKIRGKLIYSTCSTEPEENEEIVQKFLAKNPNFELENLTDFIKVRELKVYRSGQKKFLQIYPGLSNSDLDGFFMAKIRRKE